MLDLSQVRVTSRKLEGPGFVAERATYNMKELTWLRLRQTGIGGYDFGLLAFPDDSGGPLSLYFDKLTPITAVQEGNDYTDFGHDLEAVMRERTLPRKLIKLGLAPDQFRIHTSPWFYRSTVNSWHVMNIDGLVEFLVDWEFTDEGGNVHVIPKGLYVLELKTASGFKRDDWKDGATPDRYYAQAQHYPIGLGLPGTLLFCLLDRAPILRHIPLKDDGFREFHAKTCSEFWHRIETRDPPVAFGGDADLSAVRKLYPVGGDTAKVHEDVAIWAKLLADARIDKKRADKAVKSYEAWAMSEIGDASGLVSPDGQSGITWKRWTDKRGIDGQRLTPRVKGVEDEG